MALAKNNQGKFRIDAHTKMAIKRVIENKKVTIQSIMETLLIEYIVKNNRYQNINQILKQEFHISARLLHKLIVEKHVLLNNCISDTRASVAER